MTISEAQFENEMELQTWVENNLEAFLPGSIFLKGCQVTTPSGKHGVPDGFAFNFADREWYVIENELLHHGVWPHIAEQVVRFVVALQNFQSRRKLRDRLFEDLLQNDSHHSVAEILDTTPERLLQQLELFIESVNPQVVIFIDDTNQDLKDMAQALAAKTRIFRIQKFVVNGHPEYHSPDRNTPIIETEPVEESDVCDTDFDLIEHLGGGQVESSAGRFKCYKLSDNSVIYIKRSKFHQSKNYYWYGISSASLGYIEQYAVTHLIFVMGSEGFAKVPINIVQDFIQNAKVSRNPDGTIRHYHCLISPSPDPELYWSEEVPRFSLAEYFEAL